MWPSFSLCACRILKIRSCLVRPLAPGRSRVRAIFVSSVMFFSLSSAMVMVTYKGIVKRGVAQGRLPTARARGGAGSGSPPLCLRNVFRLGKQCRPLRIGNPIQYFVHGFLDAGIRLMELTRSLRRKLAEHITVSHCM